MQVTLRHLRYFLALAEAGHFGRAAAAAGVTQPALSARVAELEAITGLRLAERHARGAALTDAGRDLAARAVRVLAAAAEIEAMGDAYRGAFRGALRLGIIPSVAPYVLDRLLAGAGEAGLSLAVRETITDRLLGELEDGGLDAILASAPLGRAGIDARELGRDRFVLAVPPGAEAAADADRPPLLLLEEGHCLRDQVLAYCAPHAPDEGGGVASLGTLVELVAGGACTTLLPELFVRSRAAEAARVRIVRLPEPQPERAILLAWRRTDPRAAQFEGLAERMAGWLGYAEGAPDRPCPDPAGAGCAAGR